MSFFVINDWVTNNDFRAQPYSWRENLSEKLWFQRWYSKSPGFSWGFQLGIQLKCTLLYPSTVPTAEEARVLINDFQTIPRNPFTPLDASCDHILRLHFHFIPGNFLGMDFLTLEFHIMYGVFIKYCVFFLKISKYISDSWSSQWVHRTSCLHL